MNNGCFNIPLLENELRDWDRNKLDFGLEKSTSTRNEWPDQQTDCRTVNEMLKCSELWNKRADRHELWIQLLVLFVKQFLNTHMYGFNVSQRSWYIQPPYGYPQMPTYNMHIVFYHTNLYTIIWLLCFYHAMYLTCRLNLLWLNNHLLTIAMG